MRFFGSDDDESAITAGEREEEEQEKEEEEEVPEVEIRYDYDISSSFTRHRAEACWKLGNDTVTKTFIFDKLKKKSSYYRLRRRKKELKLDGNPVRAKAAVTIEREDLLYFETVKRWQVEVEETREKITTIPESELDKYREKYENVEVLDD